MGDRYVIQGSRVSQLKQAGIRVEEKSSAQDLKKAEVAGWALIDSFMRKVGVKDPEKMTLPDGRRLYHLGSARGTAGLLEVDGDLFLRVEAHVMQLPSDKELILPLMRELLSINLLMPGLAKMAMGEDSVFSVVMLNLKILNEDMFYYAIHSAMSLADHVDDILQEKFSGTSLKRS